MCKEDEKDQLIGLGTPATNQVPGTISELLDENVRGGLNRELRPHELRQEETSVVLSIGSDGEPIIDNSPEMEALDWVIINARHRGITPQYPQQNHEGD